MFADSGRARLVYESTGVEGGADVLLIGAAVRGAPYPELVEGPTVALNVRIEAAYDSGDLDELGRLEAWMWLDGPRAEEGRVSGLARELFLEMNARALGAEEPGEEAEVPPAWPRLAEITVPTLVMIGRLDSEESLVIDEQAPAIIPGARLMYLAGVAHVPHLEGDPVTLDRITAFVDAQ